MSTRQEDNLPPALKAHHALDGLLRLRTDHGVHRRTRRPQTRTRIDVVHLARPTPTGTTRTARQRHRGSHSFLLVAMVVRCVGGAPAQLRPQTYDPLRLHFFSLPLVERVRAAEDDIHLQRLDHAVVLDRQPPIQIKIAVLNRPPGDGARSGMVVRRPAVEQASWGSDGVEATGCVDGVGEGAHPVSRGGWGAQAGLVDVVVVLFSRGGSDDGGRAGAGVRGCGGGLRVDVGCGAGDSP
mmetsp:Transcript_28186/g.81208  ORF Transcript_28186/g.81208 Transcript_28186/m.81208 type:complete len:239 (-) Transcript_28186:882-1598(-)